MNTNLSFWERDAYFNDVDVAIIGGGIVGLNAAIYLKTKHKKLKVAVLERDIFSTGASTKNAGFCCFGSPGELLDDLKSNTEEAVFSLVERRWEGLRLLRKNLGDKNIDYHNWGGYEIFDSKEEYHQCLENLAYLNKHISNIIGIKKVYKDATDHIAGFGMKGVKGLVVNTAEGQMDTGKMMKSLIAKAYRAGVYIISPFDVIKTEEQDKSVIIHGKDGSELHCPKALICTNGFSKSLLPNCNVEPARAQVLITKPISGLKLKGAFHYDKGYYYFRNVGNRILLGGGRNLDFKAEATEQHGLTDLVQNSLEEMLHKMIAPHYKPEIEMRWSGILGLGENKSPIVEQVSENVFCAVRLGGMGLAIGSLVGKEAAEMVGQHL